jgi:hypothetical protein
VGAPIEGTPVLGLSNWGKNCSLGTNKVALSGASLALYNNEKNALLNSGSIASNSCSTFFNANPTRAMYYGAGNPAGAILTTAVTNQVPWDGVQTNISQYDAGMTDGIWLEDGAVKKKIPVCALFHGKGTTAASQIMPPAGGTAATDAYFNTGQVLAPLTQGIILHETLHNMTGLFDFVPSNIRTMYPYQPPYDLKTFVGIETTPGVNPDPLGSTNDITTTLVNNGCAANN